MIRTDEREVTFGEFSRACDLVEDYFGETIDDDVSYYNRERDPFVRIERRGRYD